jgi:hypothetical protein
MACIGSASSPFCLGLDVSVTVRSKVVKWYLNLKIHYLISWQHFQIRILIIQIGILGTFCKGQNSVMWRNGYVSGTSVLALCKLDLLSVSSVPLCKARCYLRDAVGSVWTTPTEALEIASCLTSLELVVIGAARFTAYRLLWHGYWKNWELGHMKLKFLQKYPFMLKQDIIFEKYQFVKPFKVWMPPKRRLVYSR